jgi:hypothetical protein
MYHEMIMTVALLATTANSGKSFHIGPWIIIPILILVAIIGTPIYVVRDRRKRRSGDKHR